MKRVFSLLCLFSVISISSQNNVGIGTSNPNSQAVLDIQSDDKGVLISRLTTISRTTLGTTLTLAEDGMLVYDKDMTTFFYWDGPNLQWVQVGSGTGDNWGADVVNTNGTNLSGDGTVANPLMVTEVDGDVTNEIQDLELTGNTLSLTNDATTVDLSTLKDHDWYEVGGTSQSDAISDDIFTNGRVGIGTNTPTRELHVRSGLTYVSMFESTGNNSGIAFPNSGSTVSTQAIRTSSNDIQIINDANPMLHIDGDAANYGFIGIGTTSPAQKLHIDNGTTLIQNSDGNYGLLQFDADGLATTSVSDYASISGHTGGLALSGLANAITSPHLYIDNSGDVGIGTLTPSEALDIAGSIKIVDGTEGNGKVLTSDALGKASWKSLKPSFSGLNGNIPSGTLTSIPPSSTTVISGNVTITNAGLYHISGNAPYSASVAPNGAVYISMYKNGARVEILYNNIAGTTGSNFVWHFTKYLTPGVYNVRAQNLSTNATGTVSGINFNFSDFIDVD